uniref:Uncharacterized protein n=1 Tax=Physcomitrium patens TaxID=3218 RepID=A0A2K1KQN0_PHYPA|nr:hypothetical protein PHYPA_007000 [Physcomitrium patens]
MRKEKQNLKLTKLLNCWRNLVLPCRQHNEWNVVPRLISMVHIFGELQRSPLRNMWILLDYDNSMTTSTFLELRLETLFVFRAATTWFLVRHRLLSTAAR